MTKQQTSVDKVADTLYSIPFVDSVDNVSDVHPGVDDAFNATVCTSNDYAKPLYVKFNSLTRRERFRGQTAALSLLSNHNRVPTPTLLWANSEIENDFTRGATFVTTRSKNSGSALTMREKWSQAHWTRFMLKSGQQLAELHNSVQIPYTGELCIRNNGELDTYESQTSWPEVFESRSQRVFQQRAPRFNDLNRGSVFDDIFQEVNQYLPDNDLHALLHLDYWWGNIHTNETGELKEIRNWFRAVGGDSLLNLAVAEFMLIHNSDWENAPINQADALSAFRSGYSNRRTTTWSKRKHESWRIYQLYARFRALRGFPYWYRDNTPSEKEQIEARIRKEIKTLCDGHIIGQSIDSSPITEKKTHNRLELA